jgi:hypothetical protein
MTSGLATCPLSACEQTKAQTTNRDTVLTTSNGSTKCGQNRLILPALSPTVCLLLSRLDVHNRRLHPACCPYLRNRYYSNRFPLSPCTCTKDERISYLQPFKPPAMDSCAPASDTQFQCFPSLLRADCTIRSKVPTEPASSEPVKIPNLATLKRTGS